MDGLKQGEVQKLFEGIDSQKNKKDLPEGSEVKKMNDVNKSLADLLTKLHILEKKDPKHPSVQERKKISENNATKIADLKDLIKKNPNYQEPTKENKYLGINEDNLQVDKNGNPMTPEDIWPEGIPEELQ